ncbi:MAG: HD domain-containing protein, partial [Candidatus Sumerlaeota bacterium]|nr:HD domain-containing protein [Candidatus Sumerlaeota bacterium]
FRLEPEREKVPDLENIRSPFFHDSDRILHSMAYTRYIDKTQVFYLFENDFITHRVLHVQFVSKIARTIARCLQLNEDLCEAIALGHDIGHVPFGHDGETFLNDICVKNGIGAFCHNAQSVRWMLELENKGRGLNLCLQTLDGMLCHNGELWLERLEARRGKTWEQFLEEYHACMRDQGASKKLIPMTLEGCVTRFADVIAYVGRDIEDAIKLELIRRNDLPPQAVRVLGDGNSTIINTLVMDLIATSAGHDSVAYSKPVLDALQLLLEFNYRRIYLNPRAREKEDKLRRLFEVIYEDSLRDLTECRKESHIMRFYERRMECDHIRNAPPARLVVDFISGMTDDFFLAEARRILLPAGFGHKAPSVGEPKSY